ncbi:YciI family protein [Blastomonas sp. AAP53]|uniref:YciI family protein n=1 Tax=Blastomonas sp. AAP53 TaxID=1248760 RepID=UPI00031ED2B4|nr:YciI family protein [Blastomonas sp. AAP53]
MMQYMLTIHEDESVYAGPNGEAILADTLAKHMALAEALVAAGVRFSGERLKPAATATTIRWDHGTHQVHDGAFSESHEELGGFYIIDVADLDEALSWAKRIAIPGKGAVEVRPVWPMDDADA